MASYEKRREPLDAGVLPEGCVVELTADRKNFHAKFFWADNPAWALPPEPGEPAEPGEAAAGDAEEDCDGVGAGPTADAAIARAIYDAIERLADS